MLPSSHIWSCRLPRPSLKKDNGIFGLTTGDYHRAENFEIDEKAFHGIHSHVNEFLETSIEESGQIRLCYPLIHFLKQDLGKKAIINTFPPSLEVSLSARYKKAYLMKLMYARIARK
jgi:hypothetical protein